MVIFKFGVRRFAIVFVIACAALAVLEWLRRGDNPSHFYAVVWAGAAALVVALISTFGLTNMVALFHMSRRVRDAEEFIQAKPASRVGLIQVLDHNNHVCTSLLRATEISTS